MAAAKAQYICVHGKNYSIIKQSSIDGISFSAPKWCFIPSSLQVFFVLIFINYLSRHKTFPVPSTAVGLLHAAWTNLQIICIRKYVYT